ncbi:hypothetical protein ANCCEY_14746, partial [Ancylostoma ceylanicum]
MPFFTHWKYLGSLHEVSQKLWKKILINSLRGKIQSQGVCGKFCTERWTTALARRSYTMVKLRRMDERSVALENSLPSRAHQVTERKQDETNEPMNSFLDKQEKERQRLIQQNR